LYRCGSSVAQNNILVYNTTSSCAGGVLICDGAPVFQNSSVTTGANCRRMNPIFVGG